MMILIQLNDGDEDGGAEDDADDDVDYLGSKVCQICVVPPEKRGISGAATLLRQSQRDQRRQRHKARIYCVCVCVRKSLPLSHTGARLTFEAGKSGIHM